jgi:hypothetical protein
MGSVHKLAVILPTGLPIAPLTSFSATRSDGQLSILLINQVLHSHLTR